MNWYDPSRPEQIKPTPWLPPDAVAYLEQIIERDFKVIEHGGGGSTLWFSERVESVTCHEQKLEWYNVIDAHRGENVTLYQTALPIKNRRKYDLLLIDGEPVRDRAEWLRQAQRLVKSCGWVVLDNANRPEYAKERDGLREFADLEFTSSKTGRYLVTEFWRVR
jgi:predicted O-methyltransferase YrrM